PRSIIDWDGRLSFPHSDEDRLNEAVRDTVERLNRAKHPVVIFGIETHRYRLGERIVALAERIGAPVLTSVLGKGTFPMDHPLFMGVHIGPLSPTAVCRRIEQA